MSLEPDGVHLQVKWELADVSLMPLLIVFEMLCSGDVLKRWEKANVTPAFKDGKKKGPGNTRPASFTSVSGKMINTAGNHFKTH